MVRKFFWFLPIHENDFDPTHSNNVVSASHRKIDENRHKIPFHGEIEATMSRYALLNAIALRFLWQFASHRGDYALFTLVWFLCQANMLTVFSRYTRDLLRIHNNSALRSQCVESNCLAGRIFVLSRIAFSENGCALRCGSCQRFWIAIHSFFFSVRFFRSLLAKNHDFFCEQENWKRMKKRKPIDKWRLAWTTAAWTNCKQIANARMNIVCRTCRIDLFLSEC